MLISFTYYSLSDLLALLRYILFSFLFGKYLYLTPIFCHEKPVYYCYYFTRMRILAPKDEFEDAFRADSVSFHLEW